MIKKKVVKRFCNAMPRLEKSRRVHPFLMLKQQRHINYLYKVNNTVIFIVKDLYKYKDEEYYLKKIKKKKLILHFVDKYIFFCTTEYYLIFFLNNDGIKCVEDGN